MKSNIVRLGLKSLGLTGLLFVAACSAADTGDFALAYEDGAFQECASCHAPGANGFVPGETEATQDWSSEAAAKASLQGNASGMTGNFAACNGVPLVGDTPETSLIIAALDASVRANFSVASHPGCTGDDIADMTLNLSSPPSTAAMDALRAWITAGAPVE